jgi:hypothetical protein
MRRPFIESQHLHAIYRGEISDAVIAIRANISPLAKPMDAEFQSIARPETAKYFWLKP